MFSIEIPLISLKNQKRDRMITHAMREGIEQNLLIDNKFSISFCVNVPISGIDWIFYHYNKIYLFI